MFINRKVIFLLIFLLITITTMVIYYNNIYSIKEERLENFISDKILQSYTSRSLQQLDSFIIKNYKIVTYKLSSNYYGFFIFEKGLNNKYKFVVSSIKKCYFRTFNLEGNQINDYFIIGENIYTDKILCEIDIGNKIIKRGVDTGYFVIWVEIDSKLTTSIDKIKFYNNNIDVTNVIIRGGTDRDSK